MNFSTIDPTGDAFTPLPLINGSTSATDLKEMHDECFTQFRAPVEELTNLDGNPINRADLRAIKINFCRTCVILSARVGEGVRAGSRGRLCACRARSVDWIPSTRQDDCIGKDIRI